MAEACKQPRITGYPAEGVKLLEDGRTDRGYLQNCRMRILKM